MAPQSSYCPHLQHHGPRLAPLQPLKLAYADPQLSQPPHVTPPARFNNPPLQVILLPDYGLAAPQPRPAPLQPLKLTHADPQLGQLSTEAAAYWRGLEVVSQSRLLHPCATLDFVADSSGDHAGAAAFAALQAGAAAAGVRCALLHPDEAATRTNRYD